MGSAPTLAAWQHAAVTEVSLASGAGIVRQRPGSLPLFIRAGNIPNPLIPLALKAEYGNMPEEIANFTAEDAKLFEDLRDQVISLSVEEPKLTPEDAAKLPGADRDQLWRNAQHDFRDVGLDSLESLARFRDRTLGVAPASNGSREAEGAE